LLLGIMANAPTGGVSDMCIALFRQEEYRT
jgi:hypothetical protein